MNDINRERYEGLEEIESDLLKQFEYFCVNLVDVDHIPYVFSWPREYQEDLVALFKAFKRLEKFGKYWAFRHSHKYAFLLYLAWVRASIKE